MASNWSQSAFREAYWFAARAHQGQKYPGTDFPYLIHLSLVSMEVMAALQFENCDANLAVQCAILHDVLEDTPTSFDAVMEKFGDSVANGVQALTKNSRLEKSLQMGDSLERIKKQPREIWMVKLADRICNLDKPPHYWNREKIISYRDEGQTIYDALGVASKYLGSRLLARIQDYKQYF